MRSTIIYLLATVLVLSGCAVYQNNDVEGDGGDTVYNTGSSNVETGLVLAFTGKAMGYQLDWADGVVLLMPEEQWIQGKSSLYTNDDDRTGQYSIDRTYHLISTIGVHAVDMIVGYSSGYLYMDGYDYVVRFAVDEDSFVSQYDTQMWIENDRGLLSKVMWSANTGSMLESYALCQPGRDYEGINKGANPIRCFAEDTNYVYGRKEHQSGEWGYELVRIKKSNQYVKQ